MIKTIVQITVTLLAARTVGGYLGTRLATTIFPTVGASAAAVAATPTGCGAVPAACAAVAAPSAIQVQGAAAVLLGTEVTVGVITYLMIGKL